MPPAADMPGLGPALGKRLVGAVLMVLFVLVSALTPATAAIVAQFRNLGFSPDGRYFAFMQYGVQDGAGFPFADVFVVDMERDAWVRGTPVRVLIRREVDDPRPAMREALRRARDVLRRVGIDPLLSGRTLFHAPPTEGAEPAMQARFTLHPFQQGRAEATYTLTLGIHYLPLAGSGCREEEVMRARGFRLDLRAGNAAPRPVHVDTRVPGSRNCPLGYAIDRVIIARAGWRQPTRAVVIVRYGYQAFEGLDWRHLAVPIMLPPLE